MRYPTGYIIRMFLFLGGIGGIAYLLQAPLMRAFFGNPIINGIILSALVIGIIFALRQTIKLIPEYRWMKAMRLALAKDSETITHLRRPNLLATVAVIFSDPDRLSNRLSAQSLRSVLDGVAVRLDESREISRYMIGLLVFLGLLGTFWGLLETIQSVSFVVNGIDTQTGDFGALMAEFKAGLNAPLGGMATAFSSSLFGLAGSLVLGFLDLQLGQASGRFYADLEDWLATTARFGDAGVEGLDPALSMGLSEETADRLLELTRHISKNEQERGASIATMQELTHTLTKLREQQEQLHRIPESLDRFQQSLNSMAQNMTSDRTETIKAMTTELRALSRAVAAISRKAK